MVREFGKNTLEHTRRHGKRRMYAPRLGSLDQRLLSGGRNVRESKESVEVQDKRSHLDRTGDDERAAAEPQLLRGYATFRSSSSSSSSSCRRGIQNEEEEEEEEQRVVFPNGFKGGRIGSHGQSTLALTPESKKIKIVHDDGTVEERVG